ncbi:MAG: hypothetical protein JKX79_00410 [Labilibaculum sp.]|nr:hypothetical protein [Labilibaculum sp.]
MSRSISGLILIICILFAGNSCSTGSDPEGVILDAFYVPAELALQITNVFNDLAMDVNGIAMHNLGFKEDTITENVAKCVTALVYRTSVLDSIVLNYGTSNCSSNGAGFKGKVIVSPKDEGLESFDIQLKDFSSQGFDITGTIDFQITGNTDGDDFSISMENAKFLITGTDEIVYTFSISNINSIYTFREDEEDDMAYVDDIFEFTTNLTGETPDGALFTLESVSDLIYAYSCKNIIGGKADFTLTDVGAGEVNFGGGDTDEDCDAKVILSMSGAKVTITL